MLYIIIGIILFVIAIIIITFFIEKRKYGFSKIKIDEAESNIDILLRNKFELLTKLSDYIKKDLKINDLNINMDDYKELNHFEMNDKLKDVHLELFKSIDENEKATKNKKIVKCLTELNENEEDLVAVIKFYNDNIVNYNELILSFPSNIVGFFIHQKKLDYYSNEKREIFEILKK